MPVAELKQLAETGDLGAFETRCLEALGNGTVQLAELVTPFRGLEQHKQAARVAALGQLVLDNSNPESDPGSALAIARISLIADPTNAELRTRLIALLKVVYGETPGFATLLEMSGLESGRPARSALRMLELGLSLQVGQPLISRTEDAAVEVTSIDSDKGLVSIRRDGRTKTLTVQELSREYERGDANDFRVLRQLHPERLVQLINAEPAKLVIGLIRAHGGQITADELKNELTPKYVAPGAFAKWWTDVRSKLKRDPHVSLEGRSPVVLTYRASARSVEDDVWDRFVQKSDPEHWLDAIEGYLRDRKSNAAQPDKPFLERCHAHIVAYVKSIKDRRPAEAMACAMVAQRLDTECGLAHSDVRNLEIEMLRDSPNPAALIAQMTDSALWDGALAALLTARPKDAPAHALALVPKTPATMLDAVFKIVLSDASHTAAVQTLIDEALTEPHRLPEVIYWLWKGATKLDGVEFPDATLLFTRILETLSALGRTLNPPADVIREFRGRMRSALALRDYALVRNVFADVTLDRAVRLRTQLDRLDGMGDNTRNKLLDLLRDVHPQLWVRHEKRIEPWADETVLWNTRGGIGKKTEERDTLINVTMRDNARRIGEAAQLGDLSENSEYKFALEERDFLRARLAAMNNELSIAAGIEPLDVPVDRVGIGSRVRLRNRDTGTEREITLLGPFDVDIDRGIYNYRAPAAQKLMGLRIGEAARVTLEATEADYEVVSIANGLAS